MREFSDLDGEPIDLEFHDRVVDRDNFYPMTGDVVRYTAANAGQNTRDYLDRDNFYPMTGDVIQYTAASATQNTGDYFDHDNFYPADGMAFDTLPSWERYSEARGRLASKWRKAISGTILDKKERQRRRALKEKQQAEESRNIAKATRALSKEDATDKMLAKAMRESKDEKEPKATGLSMPAKIAIGVGIAAVLTGVTILVIRRMKKK